MRKIILPVLLGALLTSSITQAGNCPRTSSPAITLADAERIALDRVGSGVIIDSERECERGHDVYEVDIRADDGRVHEIAVSVADGSIVSEELDD
jgi:uncharacterized membrane protein YkoI